MTDWSERASTHRQIADDFRQDLRIVARAIRARSNFTAAAVLTLALGIGATTAVFSVIDRVLLEPFPVMEQDRVLIVWKSAIERGFERMPFTLASADEIRAAASSVRLAAHPYHGASRAVLDRNGTSSPLYVTGVNGEWFDVLGVGPEFGRTLSGSDDHFGAAPVAVIAWGTAERLFGGGRQALDQIVRINGVNHTIVGVAPRGFAYPRGTEAWVAATPFFLHGLEGATSLHDAYQVGWYMVGRLAPGVSEADARSELQAALDASTSENEFLGRQEIRTQFFEQAMVGDVRPALLMLGAAVLLVMLIAGVNVANLLLVRGLARRRELTVRTAIGASRGRILRQLATEAAVLVIAAAVVSVFVAQIGLRALLSLAPAGVPRLTYVSIDPMVLACTSFVALIATVAFGVLPALRKTHLEDGAALRSREGMAEPGSRGYWLRHGLLVGQIAVAVLVLSSAGLMVRSLDRLQRLDLGFVADDVVLAEVVMPPGRFAAESDHQSAMQQLAERVTQFAGIDAATALTTAPFAGNGGVDAIWYGEEQTGDGRSNPYSNYEGVDAHYFRTMDLPVLRGRDIEASDRAGAQPVVVVNAAFARLYWPDQDPVGRRIKMGGADSDAEWRTVVGLVGDTRYRELTDARPSVYVPFGQGIPIRPRYIAVRTREPTSVQSLVTRAVREVEPGASVIGAMPMPHLLAEPLARPRFHSALIATFAMLGLVLSLIGTYGVLAFFVRQRRREIGIRMALGADPSNVRRFVLRQGAIVGLLGVAIGTGGAVAAGQMIEALLFEVSANDPLVLAASAAVLLFATVAAAIIPTRAATRTDPLLVMRSE